jgi:hypothetical protein
MLLQNILSILALAGCLAEANPTPGHGGRGGRGGRKGKDNGNAAASTVVAANSAAANSAAASSTASATVNSNPDESLTLEADALQTGSESNGQGVIADPGQVASLTDSANFINFCAGKTVTNGLQVKGGSCNGIVMGDIPSQANMISSIITSPAPGAQIPSDTNFTVTVQVANLVAGFFTNAASTYYAAPQQLQGGKIVGHSHITIQDLGANLNPSTPPDPTAFAFFKGINDPGNGQGLLSADVIGGLPAGNYRICTMTSAANHQPVTMPVAQRGAQDDCTKITVTGNGNVPNVLSSEVKAEEAAAAASSSAAAAGATPSANQSSTGKASKGRGGNGGGGDGKDSAASSAPPAVTTATTATAAAAATATDAATATAAAADTGKADKGGHHGHHNRKGKGKAAAPVATSACQNPS